MKITESRLRRIIKEELIGVRRPQTHGLRHNSLSLPEGQQRPQKTSHSSFPFLEGGIIDLCGEGMVPTPALRENTMLTISTKDLTWNPETLTFSTEASVLDRRGWDAAMDDLTLHNPKTGGSALFKFVSRIHDGGEVAGWRYLCRRPGLPDVSLVVFND